MLLIKFENPDVSLPNFDTFYQSTPYIPILQVGALRRGLRSSPKTVDSLNVFKS